MDTDEVFTINATAAPPGRLENYGKFDGLFTLMANIDKDLSSPRNLSLLILTIAFTSLYLVCVEIQNLGQLRKVRDLVAYWLVCDGLQKEYETLDDDERKGAFKLSLNWSTGWPYYYDGFGWVVLKRETAEFLVAVNNPNEDASEQHLFASIPDLRPLVTGRAVGSTACKRFQTRSGPFCRFFRVGKTVAA